LIIITAEAHRLQEKISPVLSHGFNAIWSHF
jgi:hypothetical protein